MSDIISIEKWHHDEEAWWDKFGSYMSYQWRLTPRLNQSIRDELEREYTSFLVNPGDRLLDLGCGSGWLSLNFANQGMSVLGVDLSQEQINEAKRIETPREDGSVDFVCADFAHWECAAYEAQFDKVFVSAFLHHLPEVELEMIFKKIAFVLKSGGKVYMYEPLSSTAESRSLVLYIIDELFKRVSDILINGIPKWFNLLNNNYLIERDRGYIMSSPHERPVDIRLLERFCADLFDIKEVRGWHLYSLGFAMQTMNLKDSVKNVYSVFTSLLYVIDRVLLDRLGWQKFSQPQRFILCSIKLIRK